MSKSAVSGRWVVEVVQQRVPVHWIPDRRSMMDECTSSIQIQIESNNINL